eukprot:gnl/TRDRNA2_/TRDRNA2_93779_c0_seq1.p2 gnl/TRDRNA2_/TRDRNA2_93779_c0~~gnl/TRDRNA2_/TRDRNA2_93779_c0_seq1.p2  ORF type:complete len:105 (+),score=15.95 gnl/TRDRNA2_/TRDRNA2_93779_c0_seq1:262-576(+)
MNELLPLITTVPSSKAASLYVAFTQPLCGSVLSIRQLSAISFGKHNTFQTVVKGTVTTLMHKEAPLLRSWLSVEFRWCELLLNQDMQLAIPQQVVRPPAPAKDP